MSVIELSQKLIKLTKLKPEITLVENQDPFFIWYANLFFLQGKKCLIFINHLTQYPIVSINTTVAEIRNIQRVFTNNFRDVLRFEAVAEDIILDYLVKFQVAVLSKNSNRVITGRAVDFQSLAYHYTDHELSETDSRLLSIKLSRTPCNAGSKNSFFPYLLFREELLHRYGKTGKFDMEPSNIIKFDA